MNSQQQSEHSAKSSDKLAKSQNSVHDDGVTDSNKQQLNDLSFIISKRRGLLSHVTVQANELDSVLVEIIDDDSMSLDAVQKVLVKLQNAYQKYAGVHDQVISFDCLEESHLERLCAKHKQVQINYDNLCKRTNHLFKTGKSIEQHSHSIVKKKSISAEERLSKTLGHLHSVPSKSKATFAAQNVQAVLIKREQQQKALMAKKEFIANQLQLEREAEEMKMEQERM